MATGKGVVGVVGLGIMGGAFARNLAADGWRVVGYDTNPKICRALKRSGIEIASDVRELAGAAPTIISALPHVDALNDTVAAIVAASVRRVLIEASTFSLADKLAAERRLSKAGHIMLDCPVSGTGSQAKTRDIVVYASGDRRTIRRLKPLFAGFARGVYDLGAFGNGSRMKYVANHLVAVNNVATAEAMVLGMKAGLDPQVIVETIKSGAGNSRVFELRAPMMAKARYGDATMKIAVWQKDMKVIGEFARTLRVPTPVFSATKPIYDAAMKSGHASDDTAVVCAIMEKMAGVKRAKGKRSR